MIPRLPVLTDGFRVFHGHRADEVPEELFLQRIGTQFMPGTPLMLRDLGLAGYLPALLPEVDDPDFPDEVAIVAYASDDVYKRARNERLIGQLYTHTHLAVFNMERSWSRPPVAAAHLPANAELPVPFWCRGEPHDWQADGAVVFGAWRASGQPATVAAAAHALGREVGVLECVGQAAATWATFWVLVDGSVDDALGLVDRAAAGVPGQRVMLEVSERVVWRDAEPPTVPAARGGAWTYVFERHLPSFFRA